jgi:hypothetical protein
MSKMERIREGRLNSRSASTGGFPVHVEIIALLLQAWACDLVFCTYLVQPHRAEYEDDEWGKVEAFYRSYCDIYTSSSSQAKGKERATPEPREMANRDATPERMDTGLEKFRAATPDGKIRRAGTPKRGTTPEAQFRAATPLLQSREKRWKPPQWDDSKWEDEVPEEFWGPGGLALAKKILDSDKDDLAGGKSTDAEFMVRS